MARRPTPANSPRVELQLKESPTAAREKLEDRVAKGEKLLGQQASDPAAFRRAQQEWTDFNELLLRKLFTTDEIRDEYAIRIPAPVSYFQPPTPAQLIRREMDVLQARIATLKSIIGRLDLIPTLVIIGGALIEAGTAALDLTRAFIVHGHDLGARDAVARVLI